MDGAALLALFAAVGFGWQPMPDGSERYEYIVQVDEELAATIASGKSIPIVGEVPEGIHPIGRVRLVIGDEALPRERLVTRLKPVVADSPKDASTNNMAAASADKSIVVRGQNATGQYNPYAAAPAPAPSTSQLFDNASAAATQAWNENVAAPASQAIANAGQNLQDQVGAAAQQQYNNAANQLQQGVNNLGQNLQNSASSLGNRSKGIVDELGRSLTQQPAATGRSVRNQADATPLAAVAPPATGAAASAAPYNAAPYNNGAAAAPVTDWNSPIPPATNPLRQDASVLPPAQAQTQQQAPDANEWNGQPNQDAFPPGPPLAQPNPNTFAGGQPAPAASSPPTSFGTPSATDAGTEWNGAPELTNTATAPPAASGNGFGNPSAAGNSGALAEGDPWRGVPDPQAPAASGGAAPNLAGGQPAPFGGAGTNWPGASGGNTNLGVLPPVDDDRKIKRDMLGQSPDRPLEGAGSLAATPTGTGATNVLTNANNAPPSVTRDIVFPNKQPSDTPPLAAQPNAAKETPSAASGDNAVVTLVAWVLLFGSVFGNLYLFWSYLDVRQKYRSLVRKTARAVGSRFSAA